MQVSRIYPQIWGFPGSPTEDSACKTGDPGSIPGSGRFPWIRKWLPTPVFLLENSMDRGAWRATVHGVTKSWDMTEQLTLTHPTTHSQIYSIRILTDEPWEYAF